MTKSFFSSQLGKSYVDNSFGRGVSWAFWGMIPLRRCGLDCDLEGARQCQNLNRSAGDCALGSSMSDNELDRPCSRFHGPTRRNRASAESIPRPSRMPHDFTDPLHQDGKKGTITFQAFFPNCGYLLLQRGGTPRRLHRARLVIRTLNAQRRYVPPISRCS